MALPIFRPPQHIVAAGACVTNPAGLVLLVRSPRRGWEFPGGQVEEGETLTQGLCREIAEETGVSVTVGALVGIHTNLRQPPILNLDFRCTWLAGELCTSPESLEVEWVAPQEALARIIRPVLRDRLRLMLEFSGQVVYRAYTVDPEQGNAPYQVYEERFI